MTLDRAAHGLFPRCFLLLAVAMSSEFVSKAALTSKQGKVRLPSYYLPIFLKNWRGLGPYRNFIRK